MTKCKHCDFIIEEIWNGTDRRIMIGILDHLGKCHKTLYDEFEKRCFEIALDYLEP
jgi:hypothetical protein